MKELSDQLVSPLPQGSGPMDADTARQLLPQLGDWQLGADNRSIFKEFRFKNFYRTMAFVNAMAWIANQTDHHPDFEVGYNRCKVTYTTHSIGGLSINDFICAAKLEKLGVL